MTTFYVLCGNSGSGKTTFAQRLMTVLGDRVQLISSDKLRAIFSPTGDESDQSVTEEVFLEVERLVKNPNRPFVIVDVTNAKVEDRQRLLSWWNGKKVLVYFDTFPELCIARQGGIERKRVVKDSAIYRMATALKQNPPSKSDGADVFVYFRNFFLSQV